MNSSSKTKATTTTTTSSSYNKNTIYDNNTNDAVLSSTLQQQQQSMTIPSSDIIRLILYHLLECGLYESCRTIQQESGIGLGCSIFIPNYWYNHCCSGNWSTILQSLSLFDMDKVLYYSNCSTTSSSSSTGTPIKIISQYDISYVIGCIHESIILELADQNEWDVAYATYRMVQNQLNDIIVDDTILDHPTVSSLKSKKQKKEAYNQQQIITIPLSRVLENKLAALADIRKKDPNGKTVPTNYYSLPTSTTTNEILHQTTATTSKGGQSQQKRREIIGLWLEQIIQPSKQPKNRLITLLQQAIKWQTYTGQNPIIKRYTDDEEEDDDLIENDNKNKNNDTTTDEPSTKKRKRDNSTKSKKPKYVKEFDLVVGEVTVDPIFVETGGNGVLDSNYHTPNNTTDMVALEKWSTIKFGKRVTPEVAIFVPDASASIITGSSDGLIEIWDATSKYTSLRTTDLPYQRSDDTLLGHDTDGGSSITALAISNDCNLLASGDNSGIVNVWNFNNGKLLRSFNIDTTSSSSRKGSNTSNRTIQDIAFIPDGSRLLVACNKDNNCREYGLRTGKVLKEFSGHTSYITSCQYSITSSLSSAIVSNTKNPNDYEEGYGTSTASPLVVVTSSGDGTVRIWNSTSADCIGILRPQSILGGGGSLSTITKAYDSISIANLPAALADSCTYPAIHTVLPLHTPRNTFIIIPRGQRAFLVTYSGYVITTYNAIPTTSSSSSIVTKVTTKSPNHPSSGNDTMLPPVFVAATVNSTNQFLFTVLDNGICYVFDVSKGGDPIHTITDFGARTTTSSSSSKSSSSFGSTTAGAQSDTGTEITSLLHHPTKTIIGAFSNNKGQSKGQLVLWR